MYDALIFAVSQRQSCQTSGFKHVCFTFFKMLFCCVICALLHPKRYPFTF